MECLAERSSAQKGFNRVWCDSCRATIHAPSMPFHAGVCLAKKEAMIRRENERIQAQRQYSRKPARPPGCVCHLCGRRCANSSWELHLIACADKWCTWNALLPKQHRRPWTVGRVGGAPLLIKNTQSSLDEKEERGEGNEGTVESKGECNQSVRLSSEANVLSETDQRVAEGGLSVSVPGENSSCSSYDDGGKKAKNEVAPAHGSDSHNDDLDQKKIDLSPSKGGDIQAGQNGKTRTGKQLLEVSCSGSRLSWMSVNSKTSSARRSESASCDEATRNRRHRSNPGGVNKSKNRDSRSTTANGVHRRTSLTSGGGGKRSSLSTINSLQYPGSEVLPEINWEWAPARPKPTEAEVEDRMRAAQEAGNFDYTTKHAEDEIMLEASKANALPIQFI